MEASSSTSSSLRRRAPFRCYCGEKPVLVVSWTPDNPGKRFYGCPNYWVFQYLSFFFLINRFFFYWVVQALLLLVGYWCYFVLLRWGFLPLICFWFFFFFPMSIIFWENQGKSRKIDFESWGFHVFIFISLGLRERGEGLSAFSSFS